LETELELKMDDRPSSERELACLIVEALHLEGVNADGSTPRRACWEGLGLDSLDLLELSMAVEQKYGVKLRSDDPDNEKIFASCAACRSTSRRSARPDWIPLARFGALALFPTRQRNV